MQRECVLWFFKIKDDMTPTEKKNHILIKNSNDNYCN